MKIKIIISAFVLFIIILALILFKNDSSVESIEEYKIDSSDILHKDDLIIDIDSSALSPEEENGLILMREEEKLAHDVYKKLGEKWGLQIFSNIASSEQTHTEAVLSLIERYELSDPAKDNKQGVFTSNELQTVYDELIESGMSSMSNALIVGATIEDLDIYDLDQLLKETNNEDIIVTYKNLQKGSRNHMRAFIKQIEKQGSIYTPQYINQSDFDSIIQTQQERGFAK